MTKEPRRIIILHPLMCSDYSSNAAGKQLGLAIFWAESSFDVRHLFEIVRWSHVRFRCSSTSCCGDYEVLPIVIVDEVVLKNDRNNFFCTRSVFVIYLYSYSLAFSRSPSRSGMSINLLSIAFFVCFLANNFKRLRSWCFLRWLQSLQLICAILTWGIHTIRVRLSS